MALAVPLIGSNMLQQLYSSVDALFVGRYVGPGALAAVGSGYYVILILTYFFIGISAGSSIVVAQAYGAKDKRRIHQAVHTAILLALLSGLLLTFAGVTCCPQILRWMNVPEDVLPQAITYLRIYFLGMILLSIYNMGSGILRAIGDTRITLYSLALSCGVNVVLDYLLIAVFSMGIAGAALATVLSQCLAAAIVLFRLVRARDTYRLQLRKIRLYREQVKRIVSIGAPMGIQSVVQCFSNLYFQSKINMFGSDAMAGSTTWSKVDGFLYTPIEGFSLAASALTGQCIGAKRFEDVRGIFKAASLLTVIITVAGSVVLTVFAPWFARIFTPNNAGAIYYGVYMLRFIEPLYFIYGMNQVFSGVIRGTGQSRLPMLIVLTFTCGFRVIWNSLFSGDFHFLLYSYPLSWTLTFIVYLIYYKRGSWLKKHQEAACSDSIPRKV